MSEGSDTLVQVSIESFLEQAETKLSKKGLEDMQEVISSKDSIWITEFKSQIRSIVDSWTLSKQSNLNYLYLIHNYLTKAKASAPEWEEVVHYMLTVLQDLVKNSVSDIDKISKILTTWSKESVFEKKKVKEWQTSYLNLRKEASTVVDDKDKTGVAYSSSEGNTKKRGRSPGKDVLTRNSRESNSFSKQLKLAQDKETIKFMGKVFSSIQEQYNESLRECGRAPTDMNHNSLNIVMFSSFYLLHHYLLEFEGQLQDDEAVAVALACIFISGKSEYFFIKCERLRSVAHRFVQQCFGSSTVMPQNEMIFKQETHILQMFGYDMSELITECPYAKIVRLLEAGTIELQVCRRALDVMCRGAYLQSQDCLNWSGTVISLTYLLLGDRLGNHNSRKLKERILSFGKENIEQMSVLLSKMFTLEEYAESSFRDIIGDCSRRVKKWLTTGVTDHKVIESTSPSIVTESPSSVSGINKLTPEFTIVSNSPIPTNSVVSSSMETFPSIVMSKVEGVAMEHRLGDSFHRSMPNFNTNTHQYNNKPQPPPPPPMNRSGSHTFGSYQDGSGYPSNNNNNNHHQSFAGLQNNNNNNWRSHNSMNDFQRNQNHNYNDGNNFMDGNYGRQNNNNYCSDSFNNNYNNNNNKDYNRHSNFVDSNNFNNGPNWRNDNNNNSYHDNNSNNYRHHNNNNNNGFDDSYDNHYCQPVADNYQYNHQEQNYQHHHNNNQQLQLSYPPSSSSSRGNERPYGQRDNNRTFDRRFDGNKNNNYNNNRYDNNRNNNSRSSSKDDNKRKFVEDSVINKKQRLEKTDKPPLKSIIKKSVSVASHVTNDSVMSPLEEGEVQDNIDNKYDAENLAASDAFVYGVDENKSDSSMLVDSIEVAAGGLFEDDSGVSEVPDIPKLDFALPLETIDTAVVYGGEEKLTEVQQESIVDERVSVDTVVESSQRDKESQEVNCVELKVQDKEVDNLHNKIIPTGHSSSVVMSPLESLAKAFSESDNEVVKPLTSKPGKQNETSKIDKITKPISTRTVEVVPPSAIADNPKKSNNNTFHHNNSHHSEQKTDKRRPEIKSNVMSRIGPPPVPALHDVAQQVTKLSKLSSGNSSTTNGASRIVNQAFRSLIKKK